MRKSFKLSQSWYRTVTLLQTTTSPQSFTVHNQIRSVLERRGDCNKQDFLVWATQPESSSCASISTNTLIHQIPIALVPPWTPKLTHNLGPNSSSVISIWQTPRCGVGLGVQAPWLTCHWAGGFPNPCHFILWYSCRSKMPTHPVALFPQMELVAPF